MPTRLTQADRFLIATALAILAYVLILAIGASRGGCHDPSAQGQLQQLANYDDCAGRGVKLLITDLGTAVHERRDDLTAISTAFIAIFTIVLAGVTGRQARLTKLVADASKEAANAAQTAADAARDQAASSASLVNTTAQHVEIAKSSLHDLQRSYMFLTEFSDPYYPPIHIDPYEKQYPSAKISIKNYGKTPANITNATISIEICSGLPTIINAFDPVTNFASEEVEIIVGDGEQYALRSFRAEMPFTQESLKNINDNTSDNLLSWMDFLYRYIYDIARNRFLPSIYCRRK